MSGVTISPSAQDGVYWVNHKEVYMDQDGKWIARDELTPAERNAFNQYIGREVYKARVGSDNQRP